MKRLTRLYLTFDKLRAGISRYGSRLFSAAVTTSLAISLSTPSVFLSRGVSLAVPRRLSRLDFVDLRSRFAMMSFMSRTEVRHGICSCLCVRPLAAAADLAGHARLRRRGHRSDVNNQHAAAVIFGLGFFNRFAVFAQHHVGFGGFLFRHEQQFFVQRFDVRPVDFADRRRHFAQVTQENVAAFSFLLHLECGGAGTCPACGRRPAVPAEFLFEFPDSSAMASFDSLVNGTHTLAM